MGAVSSWDGEGGHTTCPANGVIRSISQRHVHGSGFLQRSSWVGDRTMSGVQYVLRMTTNAGLPNLHGLAASQHRLDGSLLNPYHYHGPCPCWGRICCTPPRATAILCSCFCPLCDHLVPSHRQRTTCVFAASIDVHLLPPQTCPPMKWKSSPIHYFISCLLLQL